MEPRLAALLGDAKSHATGRELVRLRALPKGVPNRGRTSFRRLAVDGKAGDKASARSRERNVRQWDAERPDHPSQRRYG